jgi:hypothetical protein
LFHLPWRCSVMTRIFIFGASILLNGAQEQLTGC